MAARGQIRLRPVDAALHRLLAMAARAVQPARMAREVEAIVAEWRAAPDADAAEISERLGELLEQVTAGVADAEEQLADVDTSEAAAVKQAGLTLAALTATRDAALRAMQGR